MFLSSRENPKKTRKPVPRTHHDNDKSRKFSTQKINIDLHLRKITAIHVCGVHEPAGIRNAVRLNWRRRGGSKTRNPWLGFQLAKPECEKRGWKESDSWINVTTWQYYFEGDRDTWIILYTSTTEEASTATRQRAESSTWKMTRGSGRIAIAKSSGGFAGLDSYDLSWAEPGYGDTCRLQRQIGIVQSADWEVE